MASTYDIIIRGGMIMDGNGGTPFIGDVAVGSMQTCGVCSGYGRS